MRNEQIWVEPVGSVIVARIRGKATAEILRECEHRVLELARDTLVSNTRIAYLARIAFGHAGEASYRVFYNDLAAALAWLEDRAT